MEQYPENLFASVAANILKKKNGQRETHSLAKIAADYASNSQEAKRQQFLKQYNLTPDQFKNDREANRMVRDTTGKMENQVRKFYQKQSSSGMIDPESARASEQKMIQDLRKRSEGAAERVSIDRTREVASKSPDQFKNFQSLSQQSDQALAKSHGKESGAVLGSLAGGALGMLGGKRLPKNSKGILQQIGGSVGGAALGGIAGAAVGSNRDEKRTGFNHEDVMKPYEIATRISNQKNFR